jgi:hypothetical protein
MRLSILTSSSAFAFASVSLRRIPRLYPVALLSQRSVHTPYRTYTSGPNSTSPEAELKSAKDRAAIGVRPSHPR